MLLFESAFEQLPPGLQQQTPVRVVHMGEHVLKKMDNTEEEVGHNLYMVLPITLFARWGFVQGCCFASLTEFCAISGCCCFHR